MVFEKLKSSVLVSKFNFSTENHHIRNQRKKAASSGVFRYINLEENFFDDLISEVSRYVGKSYYSL